jgi:hypothetical protein
MSSLTRDQQLIVDCAIASAVKARGGNLRLLLPLLREECRGIYFNSELVAKVDQIVETYFNHRVYHAAFEGHVGATLDSTHATPFPFTRFTAALRSGWERFEQRLHGWSLLPTETAEVAEVDFLPSADDLDIMATNEKARAATEPEPPGDCGYATTMTVVIGVRCKGGRMEDLDGNDRGYCPSCLGNYSTKGVAS